VFVLNAVKARIKIAAIMFLVFIVLLI
jgi:hypothetical protein